MHSFKAYHLLVLALIASAAVQVTSGASLSAQQIVQRLESDPQMAPDEVIRLIKQLGSYYNSGGLNVALILDQDDVSERKCSQDKLSARYIDKSMLTNELPGDLDCVIELLETRYRQQLEVCLRMYTNQLAADGKFLHKLRSKTRKNVDLFYELNKSNEEKKVASLMDSSDLALAVAGEFLAVKRARRKLAGKLVQSKAGADAKIQKGLREACADVTFKLVPLMEFIKFARGHPDTWRQVNESPQLKRWQDINNYCERHNKLKAGQLDDIDPIDSLLN